MMTPEEAAAALARTSRAGMDDPTELTHHVRWYWNQQTGELNRAFWRDPCPRRFPGFKRDELAP